MMTDAQWNGLAPEGRECLIDVARICLRARRRHLPGVALPPADPDGDEARRYAENVRRSQAA